MAQSPLLRFRAEPELMEDALQACPELEGLNTSTVLRVGLLVLAGHDVRDAVPLAKRRRGPRAPA
jgi:hypothetical protein